jgi:hypothetical protein
MTWKTLPAAGVLFAVLAGYAAQGASQSSRPDDHGSISSYPVPAGEAGGNELEYCYRYSKRVWELGYLLRDRQITYGKAKEVIESSLGRLGAAEDVADIDKLQSGEHGDPDQMAGARFYRCGRALRLPVEDRHQVNAAFCFRSLSLPRYVAIQMRLGKNSHQAEDLLKASNQSLNPTAIAGAVSLVYSRKSLAEVDGLFKDLFLTCIVRAGERDKP